MKTLRPALLGFLLICVCLPALATVQLVPISEIKPQPEHRRAAKLVTHFLANYHYRQPKLDDELSQIVFDNYLQALDPTRSYFLQSDIDEFSAYSKEFDDDLKHADLQAVFDMFVRYRGRVEARMKKVGALLGQPFDFTQDETFDFDREKAPWAKSESELDELWRKRVKNDFLSLRLSGRKDEKIVETLRKRYEGIARQTAQFNSDDVFQTFANAFTTAVDPHSSYFSPRTSENFRIRMSLSLEGIGAVLQADNEFTMVNEVVKGGPADLSGKLHKGDRITGIGQGADGEIVDVVGWRLDEVVDLVRGPKSSVVRLQILPKDAGPDGPAKLVSITRNTIQLEDQAARKKLLKVEGPQGPVNLGYIELPTFYMDFDARARGDENYRSTTRDVHRLIEELEKEKIAGLIIDLRGNGGGSLPEAVELTGLFIKQGPVVQVKNSQGRVQVEKDRDREVAYAGPLAVLVDRGSASASEIFAGAIQDYHRGLILGETTFGKGTVQNLVDLNRFDDNGDGKLGQLKATIAQFFRVQGDSTQHRGVVPDVPFPSGLSSKEQGERALKHALPFARISPASFDPVSDALPNLDELRAKHEARIAADKAYQALLEQERASQALADRKSVSLLESARKAETEKSRKDQLARENAIRAAHGLPPKAEKTPAEEEEEAAAADDRGKEKQPGDVDVILDEASLVVRDAITLQADTARAAASR